MFRNFTYPGSDFHEMNLDWLLCMCQKFAGLRLEVQGDYLRLVNERNEVVSSVQVSYADHALKDIDGNMIQAYILSVGTSGDTVVFTKGDNSVTAITVPYSEKAKYDIDGHEIEDYVLHTQIAGDKLRITKGDGTVAELIIPYSIRATDDEEGNDITTYATTLAVDGDNVVLRDRKGRLLNSITVAYAIRCLQDVDGNAIKSTYGSDLQTGTTTVILKSPDGTVLSTITVPYATEASHSVESDHAGLADDATNAIETVAIVGDQIIFTTYGGTQTAVTCPYSVKSLKDNLGNEITETYVANVGTNVNTGEIIFYDAEGNTIVSIVPQVEKAKKDTYNNLIADYIKQILVDVNSNYVTVVHGTGTTDSLIINYATKALNDLNDQAIHNTYISYIECIEDVDDGHYKLVCYDGDTPKAELFRFEVTAYSAQTDINGKPLTSYVADVDYNASKQIEVTDGEGNVLKTLANKLNNVADVDIDGSTLADGDVLTYDANDDEWKNKPASGGSSGPWYPIAGATYPCAALLYKGPYVNLVSIPIIKDLIAGGSNYPTVNYGSSFSRPDGNWTPFEIIDTNFFSFLPSEFLVDDVTVYDNMASEGIWAWGFYETNVVGTNLEPARREGLVIDGIKCRYGANGLELHVYGAAKFSGTPYGPNDLIVKFLDQMDFTSERGYLAVNGSIYFTLPA